MATPCRLRRWLPDAELDAHPIASWLLELGFDAWLEAAYRRVVILPPAFRVAPGTLVVSNHQRDVDGPMLGTVLVRRRGLRFEWPLPFYATREDLFRPGILSRLTVRWPRPVRALLGRVSLAWFFPLGRAEPIRRVREFSLGETLRALADAGCGHDACSSLFNARGRCEFRVPGGATLDALPAPSPAAIEAWWGLRRLSLAAFERISPAFRGTIDAQLAHFARRLDRGRSVYFAPEGGISADGHFGRIRAGCFRLAHLTRHPPWLQPTGIAYDALAPGRPRAVVRMAPHFRADRALDRRGFDAALRSTVLATVPVTPSHLLARWLLHGPARFTQAGLGDWLERARAAVQPTHPALDPLLLVDDLHPLAHARLRWLERAGAVAREGMAFRAACPLDAVPGWHAPAAIAGFLDHQLADLAPDLDRVLPCAEG